MKKLLLAAIAAFSTPAAAADFVMSGTPVSFSYTSQGYQGSLSWVASADAAFSLAITATMNGDGRYGCNSPTSPPLHCFARTLASMGGIFGGGAGSYSFSIPSTMAGTYGEFRFTGVGTITGLTLANGGPIRSTMGAVPEPATWALMLFGFGAVGYSMRRRPTYRREQAA